MFVAHGVYHPQQEFPVGCDNNKFISHIVQKNKQNDRSDTNLNPKTNSGLSFNQDGKSGQQHVQDDKDDSQSCLSVKSQDISVLIVRRPPRRMVVHSIPRNKPMHLKTRPLLQDRPI